MRPLLLGFLGLVLLAQNQTDLDAALAKSRQRIDNIDDQIVKLLNERAAIVRDVGVTKKKFHAPASAPGRAEQVLQRVSQQARTPLSADAVRRIYATIVTEMTAMEQAEIAK